MVGVIPGGGEPARDSSFGREVPAARARQVSVEVCARSETVEFRKWATGRRCGQVTETHNVAITIVEKIERNAHAIGSKFLFDSGVERPALLGRQSGIAGKTGIRAEGLVEPGLDDALPIGRV